MPDCLAQVAREDLLRRISGEYLEMPGLKLTCEQAQRLWGLDRETCAELLGALVAARFLACDHNGRYSRVGDGAPGLPRPRMAQARLDSKPFIIKRVS